MPYVDIAAEVEPLRERVHILQNAQTERDQLQQEVQQLTNELHTLSAAFELRGLPSRSSPLSPINRTNDTRDGKTK